MLISNKKFFAAIFLLFIGAGGYCQPMEDEYGYFIFPIKPGVRNTLAGTMGELRSTHFHTGIDIRTGGQEGLAVLAAADGYISRIKVSGSGYGNTVYVSHPNGKTTVYAHLKSFRPDVESYVRASQYDKQSFEINLFPNPNQFVVGIGDTLALSGNSGSSGGPHLHFDIRDENQNLLNPLKYGFTEIVDTRVPFAKSLALITFNKDARINGEFGRTAYKLVADGNDFMLADTINAIGKIGIELYAWDRMNGTRFKTGISEIKFSLNKKETFGQKINSWSFAKARSFYQHINYKSLITDGMRYNKLYIDNGNTLGFYQPAPDRGLFVVEDGKYYHGNISLTDSYGNTNNVRFVIYGGESGNSHNNKQVYSQEVIRNTLKIVGDSTTGHTAKFMVNDEIITVDNAYTDSHGSPVFLWDITKSIPDKITLSDTTLYPEIVSMVPTNQEYKVFNAHADVIFNKRSLFDTLFFSLDYQKDTASNLEKLSIGNTNIPIKGTVTAILKPSTKGLNLEHTSVYQIYNGNNYAFVGGTWKEQQIEFKMRNFGIYTILEDSVSPTIKPLIINNNRIVFKIDDQLSGIKEVNAYLNGEWLLMARDPKKKQLWAEKKFTDQSYAGDLVLEVTDNANNKKVYSTKIN